jgi:hypothetical protein
MIKIYYNQANPISSSFFGSGKPGHGPGTAESNLVFFFNWLAFSVNADDHHVE